MLDMFVFGSANKILGFDSSDLHTWLHVILDAWYVWVKRCYLYMIMIYAIVKLDTHI